MTMKFSFRPIILCLLPLLLLSGCGGKTIKSTKDMVPGQSLAISNVYQETHLPANWIFSKPRIRISNLYTFFARFDPIEPKAAFGFTGDGKTFRADDTLPGQYHFRVFDNFNVIYRYDPHNPRYEVKIGKGEAVYIGDVVVKSFGKRFRLEIRNEEEKARAFFEKNFADSGLVFKTRLLRRVYLNPKLPK